MNGELVNQDTGEITISTDNLVDIAHKAAARIEAVKKIKGLSLKVTNCHDWVDQNGKPYLQTSGSEKIARLFGVSWTVGEPQTQQDGEDGHYIVTYKGIFTLGNASIECIGTRSSKDGFFKKYKDGKEQSAAAIDIGDVVKSAYTNLIGNGITRLLGIRNLTYDDLSESGIDVSKITKVEYKKKESSKPATRTPQPVAHIETAQCKTEIVKVGKQKNGQTTTYKLTDKEGVVYTTDQEGFVTLCGTAKNAGLMVLLTYKVNADKTIENIEILEPALDIEPETADDRTTQA